MKFFRQSLILSAFAAGVLAAVPGSAQDKDAEQLDFESMNFDEALALFRSSGNRWTEEPCAFGAPITGALLRNQPEAIPVQRVSLYARALCADEEERYEDGAALVRELNALEEGEIDVGLTFYFANRLEDGQLVLDTMQALQPEDLSALNGDNFWFAVRTVRDSGMGEEFEDLALRWFDDNLIGFFDVDLLDGLALNALRAAMRAERPEVAPQMLSLMSDPSTYIDLLTLRRFEPIWPQVEARAGPNLAVIGDENVAIARRRLTNAPNDRDRFSALAYALHYNGEFEEVIALAQDWRDREERGMELEQGDAWALNLQAYAYDSLGQTESADAVFEELAEVDPEENPWVVSFVINRASRLIGFGRWDDGLAATQYARTVPGSTFAEMIVAKDHSCALNRLGRTEEALEELSFLRENSETSVPLLAIALMCNGRRDEAAEVMLAGMRDPETRDASVGAFQSISADLFYTQSSLPDPRDLVADYPELAEEFALHARMLPEAYTPRASQRRVRLDLPDWED